MNVHRSPGDIVALREIWDGRIFEVRPAIVVLDAVDARSFYIPPGTVLKSAVDASGRILRLPHGDWTLVERARGDTHWLSFAWPSVAHAVLLRWTKEGEFLGWYVNLQTPLVTTPVGFDFTDHFLDLLVEPGGSWSWKDEDELDEALALGLLSPAEVAQVRTEGERAILRIEAREEPFDDRWMDWKPDPGWVSPALPAGWDVV